MAGNKESRDEQAGSHARLATAWSSQSRETDSNSPSRIGRALAGALFAGLVMSLLLGGLLTFFSHGLLIGNSDTVDSRQHRPAAAVIPTVGPVRNVIEAENALRGTTAWLIPSGRAATTEIQGYASDYYVSPRHTITFYISTQRPQDSYTVDIYRIGWYGGEGGRLMATMKETGQAQGYYDMSNTVLVDCQSCSIDYATHLIDANWRPSFVLAIPSAWVTGLYVAKLTTSEGREAYVHFTVTGNVYAPYLATMPDLTAEAYNDWGGYSLYHGPDQQLATRAFMVSMNRPALGWRYDLSPVLDAIRWFEHNGYNMSYTSNLEISEHPDILFTHRAYLSTGHDEYWTLTMRNDVEHARDSGIGLAFLGANAAYWNIRLEPDSRGDTDRIVVCYKSALLDPLYGKDNANVTVEWRQAPLLRPENALIGEMYVSWTYPPKGWPWYPSYVTSADPLGLMTGTGLRSGVSYGCNVVGYEWDRVNNNGAAPPGLHVLAISPTITHNGYYSSSDTVYYIAKSGALVFATGSIYFAYALDNLHIWDVPNVPPYDTCLTTNRSAAIPGIQALMANVMFELTINHHAPHRARPV